MTGRLLRPVVGVACVLSLGAAVIAWQPEPRQQPAPTGQPAGQPVERGTGPLAPGRERGGQPMTIEAAMKGLNRSMRQLRDQIGDATKRSENLRLANELQRFCVGAKGGTLSDEILKKGVDDAGKKALAEEYRVRLFNMLRLMLDLEGDIAAGNVDAAKSKLEALQVMEDEGHKAMASE